MLRPFAAAATIAIAFAPANAIAQPVLLRLSPPLGQVSTYSADIQMQMNLPGMGEITMNMLMRMTHTVAGADGDVRTMKLSVDSMSMTGGPQGMPQNMGAQAQGKVMTMQVDSRGRLVSMEMPEGVGQIPGFGSGGFGQGFTQVWLPEEPVAVGAEWVDNEPMQMSQDSGSMEMTKNLTFRFESLERRNGARHARLSVSGTVTMGGQAPAMTSSGDMRGTWVLDLDAGRFVSYEMDMNMQMEMPGMAAPTDVVMKMKGALLDGT